MKPDCESIWNGCLGMIGETVPNASYKTWFEPIVPVSFEDDILTIKVPSFFFYEHLEENYINVISQSLRQQVGPNIKLKYVVAAGKQLPGQPNTNNGAAVRNEVKNGGYSPKIAADAQSAIKSPFAMPGITKIAFDPQLNSDYTFDNFIEGDCNKLARSAAMAVAKKPGKTAFNPLFLYGNSGLGKTHLSQCIGNEVKRTMPDKAVLYINANKFQLQYTESIRNNSFNDFLNFYQMMDVLIIDDIQEFAGKVNTQNTFFHIFNHLQQSGKQIIITADKSPVEMQGMEDRLLSRFKWGLAADLQIPDFETRVSILKSKILNDGIDLPEDVVYYIANNVMNNIRELEGALISLLAQSTLNKKEITLDTARIVVDKLVKKVHRELSVDFIMETVCKHFGVEVDTLQTSTRKREIVQARQIAMYFSKSLTNASLSAIGAKIGKRDHSTVLHACKTVNNMRETDREFKNELQSIESQLKG